MRVDDERRLVEMGDYVGLFECVRDGVLKVEAINPTEYSGVRGVVALKDTFFSYRAEAGKIVPDVADTLEEKKMEIEQWSGLLNEPTFEVVKKVLSFYEVYSDEAVRALVIDNFFSRYQIDNPDVKWMRDYFMTKVPKGSLSTHEEAFDLIHYLEDVSSEYYASSIVVRIRANSKIGFGSSLFPAVDVEKWDAFMGTDEGKRMGFYLLVYQFRLGGRHSENQDPQAKKSIRMNSIVTNALLDVFAEEEYESYENDCYGKIRKTWEAFCAR